MNRYLVAVFLMFTVTMAYSQKTVNISVLDKAGVSVPAASVLVKGTTNGKMADMDGKCEINVADDNAVLVISFLGYKTEEVKVGNQTSIKVVLTEDAKGLDEVVVVGYGVVKKSDVTGAVGTVNTGEIKEMHVMGVDQALQGKAAGVDISSNSGSPGGAVTIRIRGTGTINNADPIFVVDGLVMDPGAISFLNPADIENVTILKDASATAIYGARGANGVVMINTKKGVKGEPRIQVSSYMGWQKPSHFMDLTDGREYAQIKNLRETLGGNPAIYNLDTVPNTNWFKEISRTAPMYSLNTSIAGGDDKATYLFSTSYFDQQGIIKTTAYNRLTVRLNTDYKLFKWLKFGETMQIASSKRNAVNENADYNTPITDAMLYSPIVPVYDPDSVWAYNGQGGNPLAKLEEKLNSWSANDFRFVGSAYAEIKLFKDLQFKSTLGSEVDNSEYRRLTPAYSFGTDQKAFSALENKWGKSFNWQFENYFTYNKTIKKHEISLMAGTSASAYFYHDISGQNNNGPVINNPNMQYFDIYSNAGAILNGGADEANLFGILSRLNYSYNDRYLLTASVRRDGSSKFGSDNRFGTFPSLALAWKISNEKFMQNIPFLSSLKLRCGWGQIGNENIGTGKYLGRTTQNLPYSANGVVMDGSSILSSPNKSLKWETTIQSNIGLDIGILKNQILISADYYKRNTTDMLSQIDLPDISGVPDFHNPIGNIGEVANKGIETTVSYRKQTGKLTYSVGGNISKTINEVVSLGGSKFRLDGGYGQSKAKTSNTSVGNPIGAFYGYKTDGIFQTMAEVNSHAFQSPGTRPGDLIFKDLNSDGVIDEKDMTIIGNPMPNFTYGFNLNVAYEGFDMSMAFQGVKGNDILAIYKTFTYSVWNENRNYSADLLNAWTVDNPSDIARIDGYGDFNQNARISDYFIEDGSYFRLKSLQIGYSLPKTMLTKLKMQGCRIYVGGQNLFTITKYSGNDPEVGLSQGSSNGNNLVINVDYGNVPQARTITIGFDLTF